MYATKQLTFLSFNCSEAGCFPEKLRCSVDQICEWVPCNMVEQSYTLGTMPHKNLPIILLSIQAKILIRNNPLIFCIHRFPFLSRGSCDLYVAQLLLVFFFPLQKLVHVTTLSPSCFVISSDLPFVAVPIIPLKVPFCAVPPSQPWYFLSSSVFPQYLVIHSLHIFSPCHSISDSCHMWVFLM